MDVAKKDIRKIINARKKMHSLDQKKSLSAKIFSKIERLDIFKKSDLIMAYWSLSDEVYTHDFIQKWYKTKTILLPAIADNAIQLRKFEGIQNMKVGETLGIHEPVRNFEAEGKSIGLIIVPGVAFDSKNNRLGRGGGYYDRFLVRTKAFKLGVCFNFQLIAEVPVTENDVKMDQVVY